MFEARARVAALAILLFVTMAPNAEAGQLRGRVHESQGGAGIVSLTVKLKPAHGSRGPEKITLTGDDGQFDLGNVSNGDYDLQVLQGNKQIYASPISVGEGPVNKEIELMRQ
jgi:hypothetical protein